MHRVLRPGLLFRRYNSTNAPVNPPSNPRVSSEFNGLAIPSRDELLLSQQNSRSNAELERPSYRTAHSTFAGSKGGAAPYRRDHAATQQRRAPRPNREAATTATGQRSDKTHAPRERRQNMPYRKDGSGHPQRTPRQQSSTGTGTPSARRTPNLRRFQGLDALGQFSVNMPRKSNTRDRRDRPSRGDASNTFQRGRPGARMPAPRRFAKPSAAVARSSKPTQKAEKHDVKLEVIEKGGEEPKGAALTAPEEPSVDLSEIFGRMKFQPAAAPALEHARSPATRAPRVKDRTKYIVETFGGDYTRYSPNVTHDYLTVPKELGAIKQAQLALSKNRALDLNQREILLKLISSSATSHGKQITRT